MKQPEDRYKENTIVEIVSKYYQKCPFYIIQTAD